MHIIESKHFSRKVYSYYALFELEDTLIVGYTMKNLATKPIWFNFNKICKIFRDLKQAGYVIAIPSPLDNQDTPVSEDSLYLDPAHKATDISLSNSDQTATQVFSYQQSVLGLTLISGTDKECLV